MEYPEIQLVTYTARTPHHIVSDTTDSEQHERLSDNERHSDTCDVLLPSVLSSGGDNNSDFMRSLLQDIRVQPNTRNHVDKRVALPVIKTPQQSKSDELSLSSTTFSEYFFPEVPSTEVQIDSTNRLQSGARSRTTRAMTSQSCRRPEPGLQYTKDGTRSRFCARLSAEAQYAMLKGYEDLILERLRVVRPGTSKLLYRVRSPRREVTQVSLSTECGDSSLGHSVTSSSAGSRNWIASAHRKGQQPVQQHSKRLVRRFQKAMDIVDVMAMSEGLPVTSDPVRLPLSQSPVALYNSWSQGWAREFTFKYHEQ